MSFPYLSQLRAVLGRSIGSSDGVPATQLAAAQCRLGVSLPPAMADFYLCAGAAPEFQQDGRLRRLDELTIEDGYLVFAEESRRVVDWGVRVADHCALDSLVWQRVNGRTPCWFPEELSFSSFVILRLALVSNISAAWQPDPVS